MMKKIYLKYIISLLLFGSNGVWASMISMPSYEIVLLRTMIGGILLFGIFKLTGGTFCFWKHRHQFVCLAISGIAMGMSWIFLFEAYQQIGVSMSTLVYYCGPVIVMALSPFVFKERLTVLKISGFAAVVVGVVLVSGQGIVSEKSGWGFFCGFMAAVMYAFIVIFSKKVTDITGVENALLQLVIGVLTSVIFSGLRKGYHLSVSESDWFPLLFLGVINTGIGCYLYFSTIGSLPAQSVAICGYLEPLSAVFYSVLFLHERMGIQQILGAVLIIGGAVFGEMSSGFWKAGEHSLKMRH